MSKRFKDCAWDLPADPSGRISNWDAVKVAVMMDIRDELKELNSLFRCQNFLNIPHKLDRICRNTSKPKTKAAKRPKAA